MTNKEIFINEIKSLNLSLSEKAQEYFNALENEKPKSVEITEKGISILTFMKENRNAYNNVFKAKDIGEGLSISGRSVSGSMRKLVSEGYTEKIGSEPVCYAITDKGMEYKAEI